MLRTPFTSKSGKNLPSSNEENRLPNYFRIKWEPLRKNTFHNEMDAKGESNWEETTDEKRGIKIRSDCRKHLAAKFFAIVTKVRFPPT